MGSGKVKQIDKSKLSSDKRIIIAASEGADQRLNAGSGLHGQSGIHRIQPTFSLRSDRRILQNPDSAGVIILDNNPEFSKEGSDFCSRVAIIAGVDGATLTEDEAINNYNPLKNAASVIVTQQGKSQKDLNLAIPSLPDGGGTEIADKSYDGFSDVTAYADVIQLVARNGGINLYAGGVDDKLSSGVPNREAIGVNLIYGNRIEKDKKSPYSLQPMVKGDNLQKALLAQSNRISELTSTIFQIQLDMSILKIR